MVSFFTGKIIDLRTIHDEHPWRGRVLRALLDLESAYLLVLPENSLQGRYVSVSAIVDIVVVGIIPTQKKTRKRSK